MLGGVFDDFPNLKVYVSHGGGFIPYQFGRIETFAGLISGVRCKKPPREYLKNFYFDTLIHELDARKYLVNRSEEHTSELQSLMRISYAVFCLKKKKNKTTTHMH